MPPTADAPPTPQPVCPTCGAELGSGPLGELCPACLFGFGEDWLSEAGPEAPADGTAASPSAPRRFGDYDLGSEIARGGMGVVYRARQRSLNREVALKMVLGAELADRDTQRRLQREAHAAAGLHHPHIVAVYEIGEVEFQPYFTMRLVPGGRNIADWAATRRNEHHALAAAVAQVARAVAHAHERGVLHRDLKPSNVLWDDEAGPQVTDFGLAKRLDDPRSSLSLSGAVLGSPAYMAPEQAAGESDAVTTLADVYGLGALLYEVLVGEPPFRAPTALETLRMVQEEAPVRPSQRLPRLDRDLETICLKCLEKAPARRYASAREVAEELERFSRGEPIQARRAGVGRRFANWVRRHRLLAGSLGAVAALIVAGVSATVWQWRQAEQARVGESRARAEAQETVADLLARTGFAAAKEDDPSRAAIWFAQAVGSSQNPKRRALHALRWRSWREQAPVVVRAFAAGVRRWSQISWHPQQSALLVQNTEPAECSVWLLAGETRWAPERPWSAAAWTPRTGRLVAAQAESVVLLEFPSGREVARVGSPGGEIHQAVVSADEQWIGLGGPQPWLWEPSTGRVLPLPLPPGRNGPVQLEFSRDGRHVLLSGPRWRGVCVLADPTRFTFPPLESMHRGPLGFLGAGERVLVHTPDARLLLLDPATGATLQSLPLPLPAPGQSQLQVDRPSPDGRLLTRWGAPMVDLESGQILKFPQHRNIQFAHDFSADGRWLVTGSADDSVRLWRLRDGSSQLLGWHQEEAASVAFSPDQRFVATGQIGGGLVRVWALPDPLATQEIPTSAPTLLEVSPQRDLLVPSGWTDFSAALRSTRVYRTSDGAPAGPELEIGGPITGAKFGPDATWVAVIHTTTAVRSDAAFAQSPGSGVLQCWDFRTGQPVGTAVPLPAEPRALAVHPSGQRIAIFGAGRSLYEVERSTGAIRVWQAPGPFFAQDEASTAECRYSPDGSVVVARGRGHPPLLWNAQTGTAVDAPGLRQAGVWSMDLHGDVLATGSRAGNLDFTQLPSGRAAAPSIPGSNWLFFVQFDPTGQLVLTGGRGRQASVWRWRESQPRAPASVSTDELFCGAFVPGTPYVLTGSRDECLEFWDLDSGQPARSRIKLGGFVKDLRVLPGGRLVINLQQDGARRGILLANLDEMLAAPTLPPVDAIRLAELDAAAEIREGTLVPLTASDWWKRWREFRAQHPTWHRW